MQQPPLDPSQFYNGPTQNQPPTKPPLFDVKARQTYYQAHIKTWPKWKKVTVGCGPFILAFSLCICAMVSNTSTPSAQPVAALPTITQGVRNNVSGFPVTAALTHAAPTATPTSIPPTIPIHTMPTPQPKPQVKPIEPPPAQPTQPPPAVTGINGNPYGYDFTQGNLIYNPASDICNYLDCIASFWNGRGYVMECQDGMYSKSGGIRGSCSRHGGNMQPLYQH